MVDGMNKTMENQKYAADVGYDPRRHNQPPYGAIQATASSKNNAAPLAPTEIHKMLDRLQRLQEGRGCLIARVASILACLRGEAPAIKQGEANAPSTGVLGRISLAIDGLYDSDNDLAAMVDELERLI